MKRRTSVGQQGKAPAQLQQHNVREEGDRTSGRSRVEVNNEQIPLPYGIAGKSVVHCIARTALLLVHRRIHLPQDHVGMRLRFANGTSAPVYQETVVDSGTAKDPCVLMVEFRLRGMRGWLHTIFRWESMLNTPLFVGFPGFASKLWLANDENEVYRGVYEWDGPQRAEHYARSLWRVLALGSVRGSIHYMVLPGLRRDEALANPHLVDTRVPDDRDPWWRLVEVA